MADHGCGEVRAEAQIKEGGGGGAEALCGQERVPEKECVCERKRARELGDIISASGRAGDHLKAFKDF